MSRTAPAFSASMFGLTSTSELTSKWHRLTNNLGSLISSIVAKCLPMMAAVTLTACAGTHLHNEEKAALAKSVQTAYKATSPKKVINDQRANLDRLLVAEKDVAVAGVLFLRDEVTWRLVNQQSTGGFDADNRRRDVTLEEQIGLQDGNVVARRLSQLGISDSSELENAVSTFSALVDGEPLAKEAIAQSIRALQAIGWQEVWDCTQIREADASDAFVSSGLMNALRPAFENIFDSYRKNCLQSFGIEDFSIDDGLIAQAVKEWSAWRSELEKIKSAQKQTAHTLKSLKIPATTTDKETFITSAQSDAGAVAGLITDSTPFLQKLGIEDSLATARLEDLTLLLEAVNNGSLDGLTEDELATLRERPGFFRTATLAAGLPGFGNDVEALFDLLKKPEARTDLLIQRAALSARSKYLKQRLKLVEERVSNQKGLLIAYLREVYLLYSTTQFLAESGLQDKTVSAVFVGTDQIARESLYQALVSFDHSYSLARKQQAEIEVELGHYGNRQRLAADEYAIDTWNALLAAPIDQLVAYHEAGITSEAVADAMSGLIGLGLLGFIAVDGD